MNSKQQITDKQFDQRLNDLVGMAIMNGVNPAVVIGCLTMSVQDVYKWKMDNDEKLRQLHEQLKTTQLTAVDPDGPSPEQLKKDTIEAAEAIMQHGVKNGILVEPEAKGIDGVIESGIAPSVRIEHN